MGFGGATLVGTMIPIVNFIVMPAAVAGATALWVGEKRIGHNRVE
jgi:CysZ protein